MQSGALLLLYYPKFLKFFCDTLIHIPIHQRSQFTPLTKVIRWYGMRVLNDLSDMVIQRIDKGFSVGAHVQIVTRKAPHSRSHAGRFLNGNGLPEMRSF
jgi:hypothetical protein